MVQYRLDQDVLIHLGNLDDYIDGFFSMQIHVQFNRFL